MIVMATYQYIQKYLQQIHKSSTVMTFSYSDHIPGERFHPSFLFVVIFPSHPASIV